VRKAIDPAQACVEDVLHVLTDLEKYPRVTWVNDVQWFEIDTLDDLEKARKELA
jgi:choline kinase